MAVGGEQRKKGKAEGRTDYKPVQPSRQGRPSPFKRQSQKKTIEEKKVAAAKGWKRQFPLERRQGSFCTSKRNRSRLPETSNTGALVTENRRDGRVKTTTLSAGWDPGKRIWDTPKLPKNVGKCGGTKTQSAVRKGGKSRKHGGRGSMCRDPLST